MTARLHMFLRMLVLAPLLVFTSCGDTPETHPGAEDTRPAGIITLGDIEPDEPATRVRRLQPLADYLGVSMAEFGIGRGRVLIARDIEEMSQFIANGKVDFYLDSPYPVLAVNAQTGSKSLLLRQAKDDAEYWSVFIVLRDSELGQLSDLSGEVVLFQEQHSTSGFLLPVSTLLEQGFELEAVRRLENKVPDGKVGCHFSGDEENTIELVLNGSARLGVISNQDFRELPDQMRKRLKIIGKTESVPRQLVAVRQGLDPVFRDAVRDSLLSLTDAQRAALAAQDAPFGWTWKFSDLSDQAEQTLARLEAKMDLLPACAAQR